MAMATAAGALGPYTRADLEHTPDDGRRYELIDGYLYVSAAPGRVHQRAVTTLVGLMLKACPPEFEVLCGPFAVALSEHTEIQPDVLVGRRTDFTEREIVTPALVVEVLSPRTRMVDTHIKRARLERAGIRSYWIVDRSRGRPRPPSSCGSSPTTAHITRSLRPWVTNRSWRSGRLP
jgi:Uma2 family endonuclease